MWWEGVVWVVWVWEGIDGDTIATREEAMYRGQGLFWVVRRAWHSCSEWGDGECDSWLRLTLEELLRHSPEVVGV